MNASFIYSFILYNDRRVTTLPAVRIRTSNQAASRKLIANAFRACSSFFIRWSSYNNNARGLNEIVLNNHFFFSFFFLALPLMHTLHLLSSSLTTKFSSDTSYQHFSSITNRNAFIIDRFNDWIIVYFNISQKKRKKEIERSSSIRTLGNKLHALEFNQRLYQLISIYFHYKKKTENPDNHIYIKIGKKEMIGM